MRLTEWIGLPRSGGPSLLVLVERFVNVNRVEKPIIHIELDAVGIPVHPPYMELRGPVGIVEVGNGYPDGVPLGDPSLLRSPGGVCQEQASIVFHDIDLAAAWPPSFDAQRPEGGPETATRIDPGSHFETAIHPVVQTPGRHACGRILRIFPVLLPALAIRLVTGVLLAFASGLNDKQTLFASGVVGLIPLSLVVPNPSGFVGPLLGVRPPLFVELIGPDQLAFG